MTKNQWVWTQASLALVRAAQAAIAAGAQDPAF